MIVNNFSCFKYRPDIDGLRGLAIFFVIIFHAFPTILGGGFVGVDIFFVISGYLISRIILEKIHSDDFNLLDFYLKRIKRIFPALFIVLVFSITFGWQALLPDEYRQLGKHIFSGATFSSNLILWQESGYFDNAADTKPLLHLWSLSVEEQFYIFWPILLLLFFRAGINFFYATLLLIAISFIWNLHQVQIDVVGDFFSPQSRCWELLSGSIVATTKFDKKFFFEFSKTNIEMVQNSISIFGFVLIIYGLFGVSKVIGYPGMWGVFPVFGACAIILAGPDAWLNRVVLSNKIVVWFGLISFPLYLWHWPLLSFGKIVQHQNTSMQFRLVILLLSIFLAWLTFEYLEKKIRQTNSVFIGKILVCCISVVGLLGYTISYYDGLPARNSIVATNLTPQAEKQLMGPLWKYAKNDLCLANYPFDQANHLSWWFCMKSSSNAPNIILLGNSFANQLYPGFIENKRFLAQTILSIGTCDFGTDGSDIKEFYNPCYGDRARSQEIFINKIIEKNPSIKVAIIDGLSRNPNKEYIERVTRRVGFLENLGLRVVIFTPHLKPDFNPKLCYKTPLRARARDCTFPVEDRNNLLESFKPLIDSISISNPGVLIFEQNGIFCDDAKKTCSWIRDGIPLHRDEAHTSEYASILLQSYFNKWLDENGIGLFD